MIGSDRGPGGYIEPLVVLDTSRHAEIARANTKHAKERRSVGVCVKPIAIPD